MLLPALVGDFKYRVSVQFDNEKFVVNYGNKQPETKSELVQLYFGTEALKSEIYTFHIEMVDTKHIVGFSIWPNNYAKQLITDEITKKPFVIFGNYFKLEIEPKLKANSGMFYRVNTFCAGSDQLEFDGLTNSAVMVVFNSEQRKCDQYKVKVWPIHEDFVTENEAFDGYGLVQEGISVTNGGTHRIYFPNYFYLNISPKISAKTDKFYWVEVNCHDASREAEKYITYTQKSALIVLNCAQNCAEYDILVRKLDKKWLTNAIQKKLNPSNEKAKKGQIAVKILNGEEYEFVFQQTSPFLKRVSDNSNNQRNRNKQQKLDIKIYETPINNEEEINEQQQEKIEPILTILPNESGEKDEKRFEEISEKVHAVLNEIAKIKQEDATKFVQMFTFLKNEMANMRKEDEKKFEEIIKKMEELQKQIEESTTNKNEAENSSLSQFTAANVRNETVAIVKLEYEKKFERMSEEMGQLKEQITSMKHQIGQNESNFVRTIEEIKRFMEEQFKDE
ncbi:hypothetical protein niasHS_005659 [Heterodera schachtii]|uniref:Uncharacterized protein n=1 Tax=Heterodera schachtii TaxID=97005 RepID=A0ABD2JZ22_HETSC